MNNTFTNSQPEMPANNKFDKLIDMSPLVKETISNAKTENMLPETGKIVGRSFFGFWEIRK